MRIKLSPDVQEVVDIYRETESRWQKSRLSSLENYRFYLNEQWSDEEIADFLNDNRPPIQYNLILPRLHNLIGSEQQNRRSARIRPASAAMREKADTLNGLMNAIWEKEEGEFEFEKMFLDGLICKVPGVMGIYVEPNDYGFLEYRFRCLNPLSVHFDPDYRDYKLRDCNWVIIEQWMSREQIADTFGDSFMLNRENRSWWTDLSSRLGGMFGSGDENSIYYDKDGDRYKVLEMQTRVPDKKIIFADLINGGYVKLTKDEAKLMQGNTNYAYLTESTGKRIHIKTIIPYLNEVVVDEPYFINTSLYNVIPYCSIDGSNLKSENSSLVSSLIDPQKNLNKREIQKTSFIDHVINSPILFSYLDKDTKEAFETNGNKPGLALMYRDSKNRPSRMSPPPMANDIWNDIADSKDKMNDISGINETARGNSEFAGQSARLFSQMAERTGATLNPYFRNLSKSRKMFAEYFLSTVSQVYGEEDRLVEVMDITGKSEQVVLNSINGVTLDNFEGRVILDDAEYSPSRLQQNFQVKMTLAQTMPPEYVNWSWILKDMELPDIEEQIEYIRMVTGMQADAQAMQQVMSEDQAVTQQLLAEKQLMQDTDNKENPKSKSKEKKK